jgi:hypothetical protein
MLSDISSYLTTNGITTTISINNIPPSPLDVVALQEHSGEPPETNIIKSGLLVIVRGSSYSAADTLLRSIYDILHYAADFTVNGHRYIMVKAQNAPYPLPATQTSMGVGHRLAQSYVVWIAD